MCCKASRFCVRIKKQGVCFSIVFPRSKRRHGFERWLQMTTFIDMFAAAGGFSEGFLQAEENGQYFDFLLGSDINPTCEVTHRMRYNEQLGLDTEFLTKDITAPDFIEELLERIQTRFGASSVDVLTGGPPCQSFSLAGERRKNDKKDDLFCIISKS